MEPTEIRQYLLNQHASIRALAAQLREQAVRARTDPDDHRDARASLRTRIAALQAAVVRHNADEQRLLEGVLPGNDAWGLTRFAAMCAHHHEEHAELQAALGAAGRIEELGPLAACIERLVEALLDHMREEEQAVLHAHVLRDDVLSIDAFGG